MYMSPEVRRATISDIPTILDYLEKYHEHSNLNHVDFDRTSCFKIVQYYIQHTSYLPLIAWKDEAIIGVLFGSLEPYFFNQKQSYATDLMFISNGAGPQLWKYFRDWAFTQGAKTIMMGVSSGDSRAEHLLEALGMQRIGGTYVLRS